MEVLGFAIFCLFVFRVSSLFVYEDGPFDMFKKIRDKVGIDDTKDTQEGYLAKLFFCVSCISVMIALPFWPLYFWYPSMFIFLGGFLAASAVVMFLEKLYR
jgi:hypothetical protein